MKAITQDHYGPIRDVLRFDDIPDPKADGDDVLVRVHAASIHIGDVYMIQGLPKAFRPIYGLRRPRARVPGTDLAGTVEAVGDRVTGLRPGDAVLGWGRGAFAELAVVRESQLIAKPDGIGFEDASMIGVSALAALQALRDLGRVQAGQHVLVTGASGGVGSFAVQIAKASGAQVTGVCGTRNVEIVRSLGADHIIDREREDLARCASRFDVILDNVGTHPLGVMRRLLTRDGRLISNGFSVGGWFGGVGHVLHVFASSVVHRQQTRPLVSIATVADLVALRELFKAAALRPLLDRAYPLPEAAAAIEHVAERSSHGTTVIRMT